MRSSDLNTGVVQLHSFASIVDLMSGVPAMSGRRNPSRASVACAVVLGASGVEAVRR